MLTVEPLDETVATGDEGRPLRIRATRFDAEVILDDFNKRLTVRRYRGQAEALATALRDLAAEHRATKVVVLAGERDWTRFVAQGYIMEGLVPCHFQGYPGFFLARFLNGTRRFSADYDQEDDIFRDVMKTPLDADPLEPPAGFEIETAGAEDAQALAAVYGTVFDSYPTPLHDAAFIRKAMGNDESFLVCRHRGRVVSAASGCVNAEHGSAELTACATLPNFRGKGLIAALLAHLQRQLADQGFTCLYSMARAKSSGMNKVFRRLGYTYQGRLVNHCHIMGDFEDVNLWVQELA